MCLERKALPVKVQNEAQEAVLGEWQAWLAHVSHQRRHHRTDMAHSSGKGWISLHLCIWFPGERHLSTHHIFKHTHTGQGSICRELLFSGSVAHSLRPHELQHTRLPCPLLSPWVCSNSCPLSRWRHPTNSSSVTPFSCCQSCPASGSFPVFPTGRRATPGGRPPCCLHVGLIVKVCSCSRAW